MGLEARIPAVHILVFGFLIFGSVVHSAFQLDQISLDCTRDCDSHFSDEKCWEKTFDYFINQMFKSVVDYDNAAQASGLDASNLTAILDSVYEEYKKNDGIESLMTDVVKNFQEIYDELKKNRLLSLKNPGGQDVQVKCPTKCASDSLNLWISLFGAFMGSTVVSISFIAAYLIFSKYQYLNLTKK